MNKELYANTLDNLKNAIDKGNIFNIHDLYNFCIITKKLLNFYDEASELEIERRGIFDSERKIYALKKDD